MIGFMVVCFAVLFLACRQRMGRILIPVIAMVGVLGAEDWRDRDPGRFRVERDGSAVHPRREAVARAEAVLVSRYAEARAREERARNPRDSDGGVGLPFVAVPPATTRVARTRRYTRRQLEAIVIAAARRHGVDPLLLLMFPGPESSWRFDIVNPESNAHGLFQHLPQFALPLRSGLEAADLLDPGVNADLAAERIADYTGQLRRRFGNLSDRDLVRLLAASWVCGISRVKSQGRVPRIPEITDYVDKVLDEYHRYRNSDILLREREGGAPSR